MFKVDSLTVVILLLPSLALFLIWWIGGLWLFKEAGGRMGWMWDYGTDPAAWFYGAGILLTIFCVWLWALIFKAVRRFLNRKFPPVYKSNKNQ